MVEVVGWLLVVGIWTFTGYNYQGLPNIIPIHFNGAGVADGFGGRENIFTLPIVATILFIGLTLLNGFPHMFNYPTEITESNALTQYTKGTRLIRFIKTIIVLVFGFISLQTVQYAKGQTDGLGSWFLPFILALIFLPVLYFLSRFSKSSER